MKKLVRTNFDTVLEELDKLFEGDSLDDLTADDLTSAADRAEEENQVLENTIPDLESILEEIEPDKVSYVTLGKFFSTAASYREEIIKDEQAFGEYKKIQAKLATIASTALIPGKTWYETLQYTYNAHIAEGWVLNHISELVFGGNENEHDYFFASSKDVKNAPDFSGCPLLNTSATLEIKNYGTTMSAKKELGANDRKPFHNANFILFYIMSPKENAWYITQNTISAGDSTN